MRVHTRPFAICLAVFLLGNCPVSAESPSKTTLVGPASGATCVATSQTLEWTPGTPSTGVRVYFGTTSLDEVNPDSRQPVGCHVGCRHELSVAC